MIVKITERETIKPFLDKVYIPPEDSHKGQNGKVLIIGGSKLFHAASLWAAEIASHFVDMVHYSSTDENEKIFLALKTMFRNGIIVPREQIRNYVVEDDAVLIGPGMVRSEATSYKLPATSFNDILKLEDESQYAQELTHYLLKKYPEKKFVIDAGALQMMEAAWLKGLKQKAIITPHQGEFERLFNTKIANLPVEKKAEKAKHFAREYNCVILLKAVVDIITDGVTEHIVSGGNAGLTKGGTGDILAGLTVSLYAKNDPIISSVVASYLEKSAALELASDMGYWYNNSDLIRKIPLLLTKAAL